MELLSSGLWLLCAARARRPKIRIKFNDFITLGVRHNYLFMSMWRMLRRCVRANGQRKPHNLNYAQRAHASRRHQRIKYILINFRRLISCQICVRIRTIRAWRTRTTIRTLTRNFAECDSAQIPAASAKQALILIEDDFCLVTYSFERLTQNGKHRFTVSHSLCPNHEENPEQKKIDLPLTFHSINQFSFMKFGKRTHAHIEFTNMQVTARNSCPSLRAKKPVQQWITFRTDEHTTEHRVYF